jgi:sugar phosphate isomerase/epimerase
MNIPIALQLYSVRQDASENLPAVLEAVKKMGYDGVEFAGFYNHDAQTVRRLLDDNGLQVVGAHVGIDTLLGDEFKHSVEFHQTIGNTRLIVPGLSEKWRSSTEAWKNTAQTLNEIAARLAPEGLQTGYHNHAIEFQPFEPGGELPWDTFFGNTNPQVIMQFDTGNALHGGADALPFLKRYPGRAKSVHLKEYDPDNDKALIGEGKVPWTEVFAECESRGGTEVYVVEQESYAYPPLECAAKCREALKAYGK